VSSRRRAREVLLTALYTAECRETTVPVILGEMDDAHCDVAAVDGVFEDEMADIRPFAARLDDTQQAFVLRLAEEIDTGRDRWNECIGAALVNWDFSRVARIDRIIMWIALAEMSCMPDIPVRVSINEALELARSFSSEKSTGFINGVLDTVARELGFLKDTGK
jgi:transcription antitermination protein NusB